MKGFTHCRCFEMTLFPLSVTPGSCNPGSNDSVSRSSKMGFTLMELLVVVLIIGILATIALPKYKVAVAKAKVMRLMPLMQTINNANEAFYLANGYYTYVCDLDVNIPQDYIASAAGCRDFWYADGTFLSQCGRNCGDKTTISGGISYKGSLGWAVINIVFYGQHSDIYPGRRKCIANHFPGHEICKSLGGVLIEGKRNEWLLP